MRKTSLPTRSIVPKGGPLPSVLEDAHQRRHDEEEEEEDDESETLLLSRKDANATRRRFDALEEEEENDVLRPPGLSHAAVREDGDGDSGDDFSGDDDDDDENLDRFFSRLYQQFVGKVREYCRSNSERFDPPVYDLDVWFYSCAWIGSAYERRARKMQNIATS